MDLDRRLEPRRSARRRAVSRASFRRTKCVARRHDLQDLRRHRLDLTPRHQGDERPLRQGLRGHRVRERARSGVGWRPVVRVRDEHAEHGLHRPVLRVRLAGLSLLRADGRGAGGRRIELTLDIRRRHDIEPSLYYPSTTFDFPRCFQVATIVCHSNCRRDKTDLALPDWVYEKVEGAEIRLVS
jgi:hypothetical protein